MWSPQKTSFSTLGMVYDEKMRVPILSPNPPKEEIKGVLMKPSAEDLKKAEIIGESFELGFRCVDAIAQALADQREEDSNIAKNYKHKFNITGKDRELIPLYRDEISAAILIGKS